MVENTMCAWNCVSCNVCAESGCFFWKNRALSYIIDNYNFYVNNHQQRKVTRASKQMTRPSEENKGKKQHFAVCVDESTYGHLPQLVVRLTNILEPGQFLTGKTIWHKLAPMLLVYLSRLDVSLWTGSLRLKMLSHSEILLSCWKCPFKMVYCLIKVVAEALSWVIFYKLCFWDYSHFLL